MLYWPAFTLLAGFSICKTMTKQKDGIARLFKFGATGVIEFESYDSNTSHCHMSGCSSDPVQFCQPYHWWAHPAEQLSRYWDNLEIPAGGVVVLDIRAAMETPDGYSWVFRGPMLDVRLKDGEIDRLGDITPLMVPVIANYGMAGCLAETRKAQAKGKAGSLDEVSLAEYVQGWREHGARVGLFKLDEQGNGVITWE